MKLKLKNIGTLKQAEIDLSKDLIILAGPNNTGKTYAAYTVYGVCNLLRKSRSFSIMDNQTENDVIKYFNNFKNGQLEINIIDLFNSLLLNLTSVIDKITVQQLENVFAPNTTETFKDSNIQILEIKENVIDYLTTLSLDTEFSFSTILTHSKRKIHLLKKSDNLSLITSIEDIGFGEKYTIFDFSEIVSQTKNYIFERIVDLYFNNLYISTAERSAINIFSKELSIKRNTIVDQLLELRESKNGVANQLLDKLQRYSLPIRDSLEIAEDLANLSRNKGEYAFLADKMEEVLLDGKINISKYGEVQYSPNKSKVKNLSMNLSGSIVKSLSSLIIYFRHLAQKGDFIIIDEPELNLHPDNQRKITRLIGEFVN